MCVDFDIVKLNDFLEYINTASKSSEFKILVASKAVGLRKF